MSLHWNSDFEVGILELDNQQQELFTNFETFSSDIEKEHGHHDVSPFIAYLEEYSQKHFKYEEGLQEKVNYPGREQHFVAHRRFIDELESFKSSAQWEGEPQRLSFALKAMVIRWLITHSKHLDVEFCRYLEAVSENAKQGAISKKLGEILVDSHYITPATLDRALASQQETGRKLGLIMVEMGVVSKDDIRQALKAQEGKTPFSEKLGQILVEAGLITFETLERALQSQQLNGKVLGAVLVDMGVVDPEEVMYAQAVQKGMLMKSAL
jgi:hemerythrin-like metal-binding protein